jgi:hypothetical protein
MNSILSQNYFLYMWTTLEDLFGCEVIAWMNGGELAQPDHQTRFTSLLDNTTTAAAAATADNYMDPNEHRQVLSTGSQNVAQSLATLLYRAVQHAERSTDLGFLFDSAALSAEVATTSATSDHHHHHHVSSTGGGEVSDSPPPLFTSVEERRVYHQAKQTLLSRAEIRRANPAFNSTQWNFLGLLLVDALVTRKVLLCLPHTIDDGNGDDNDDIIAGEEVKEVTSKDTSGSPLREKAHHQQRQHKRAEIWNSHFSQAALKVLGGQAIADSLLEPRELKNLRTFFDVDN